MRLDNDITVNGRTFKAGMKTEVPKNQADDLARMDHEHTQYLLNLSKKQVYTDAVKTNIQVGSVQ